MSEPEKKPVVEPQAPEKHDGPLTALKKLTAKKPAEKPAEPVAPPVEPVAPVAETPVVSEPVVVVPPGPKRCKCGRKWSAPAPDRCPACGGELKEE